jgi:hypothetical protein
VSEIWWPKALRQEYKDAGVFVGGRPKGVLHTTEGTSYGGAQGSYAGAAPHFTVSFERQRFEAWQHVPLNRAARALRRTGGTETNRANAIQIEIVGYADADKARTQGGLHVADFPDVYLDGLADLMRWIEVNAGVSRRAAEFRAYPASFGSGNGVRFGAEQWRLFDGWCGHLHVPDNDHGDPGEIDIARLVGANGAGNGQASVPSPAATRFPGAVHAASCPGGGSWVVGSDGGVGSYRGAPFHGSIPGIGVRLEAPVVAILPHGRDGYWLVAADGGVFNFGDAPQIAVYQPFFAEYGRGDRRAVGAIGDGTDTLVLLADDGAEYRLGRA